MLSEIKNKLKNYKRNVLPETGRIASVLLPFVMKDGDLSIILTKRALKMPSHSGEISFPGGMKNKEDSDLIHTALRETQEEIGIASDKIEILGSLDDEISQAGYRVTPFVGFIADDFKNLNLTLNGFEVEKVFCIPYDFFLQNETHWQESWIRRNELRRVYFYLFEDEIIWGLTAKMIYKLINL